MTSDAETAVCNLGSINLAAPPDRRRRRVGVDWDKLARHGAHRGPVPRPGDRPQLLPERAGRARRTRAGGRSGLGVMGLQDVFFALRLPFDAARGPRAVHADLRGDLLQRPGGVGASWPRRTAPHPAFAETRAAARRAAARPVGRRRPTPADALGRRCGRGSPQHRPAQLAADRDRADRDHRLHRRLLRVHRAAGLEPVQARDPVRRVPAGQHATWSTSSRHAGSVDRRRCATRSSWPRARCRGIAELPEELRDALPHGLGAAACGR